MKRHKPKPKDLYSKKNTLCWSCKRSIGDCEWSNFFVPVYGWNAEKTTIRMGTRRTESYRVISCPKYIRG